MSAGGGLRGQMTGLLSQHPTCIHRMCVRVESTLCGVIGLAGRVEGCVSSRDQEILTYRELNARLVMSYRVSLPAQARTVLPFDIGSGDLNGRGLGSRAGNLICALLCVSFV